MPRCIFNLSPPSGGIWKYLSLGSIWKYEFNLSPLSGGFPWCRFLLPTFSELLIPHLKVNSFINLSYLIIFININININIVIIIAININLIIINIHINIVIITTNFIIIINIIILITTTFPWRQPPPLSGCSCRQLSDLSPSYSKIFNKNYILK